MKLIFDTEKGDERYVFECAQNGPKFAFAFMDLQKWFRDKLKYGHEYTTADAALEMAREEMNRILNERGLDRVIENIE